MKANKHGVLLLLLFSFITFYSKGVTTYYSIASGDFSSTSVWSTVSASGASCGCTPSGGNIIIIIEPGDNITYSTPSSYTLGNSNSLTISAGATFDLGTDSLLINGSGTVTVNGSLTANGIDVSGSGKLIISAGTTVTDNGNFTSSGSGATTDNGTLKVAGNSGLSGSGNISGSGTMKTTGKTHTSGGGTIWGSGGVNCAANCVSSTGGTSLPITLLSFTAVYNNDAVLLTWASATETNNNYYTVERTVDGNEYTLLEKVKGAGNSSDLLTYNATDPSPAIGLSYYRLSQTDFDGNNTILGVLPVTVNIDATDLKVFPNPAKNSCTVSFTDEKIESFQLTVYDYTGRQVLLQNEETAIGVNSAELNISSLSQGMYFITLPASGHLLKAKFIKN
jgi:hypothetical protein